MKGWPDEYRPPEQATSALWGRCADEACKHLFPVVFLPMDMAAFGRMGREVRCPACAGRKVMVAHPGTLPDAG